MRSLERFAWFVLLVNVVTIALGAVVRSTGSGAGCGRSWPTCQGEIVPELAGATAVEFTHRAVSGVALVLVFSLAAMVWRQVPAGGPARVGVVLSTIAIVVEALIGAMIVLSEWVADDASVARAVSVPLHLVNTLFLLGALTMTIFWLRGGGPISFRAKPGVAKAVWVGGAAIVLLAASGAITALADTLFPSEGIAADFTEGAHFLTRLRVFHPTLAIIAAGVGWWAVARTKDYRGPARTYLPLLVLIMLITGVLNVLLGVPVWMQVVHLVAADVLWIVYVLVSAAALEVPVVTESRLSPSK